MHALRNRKRGGCLREALAIDETQNQILRIKFPKDEGVFETLWPGDPHESATRGTRRLTSWFSTPESPSKRSTETHLSLRKVQARFLPKANGERQFPAFKQPSEARVMALPTRLKIEICDSKTAI